LRRPGRPRLALRQSGVAQVLADRIPRDAELLGNASDRVVVPIQGVNLFHFSTLQQGPQPPNPLAGSLESRIRWRVGHFHPAPGSRVNRPQQLQVSLAYGDFATPPTSRMGTNTPDLYPSKDRQG